MTEAEIIAEIEKLEKEASFHEAMQMALKLVMNGSYGALANAGFACSNMTLANAITVMGRSTIKHIIECHKKFWATEWHTRTDIHEKLNIKNVKPIPECKPKLDSKGKLCGFENIKEQVIVYGDTDSVEGSTKVYLNNTLDTIENHWNASSSSVMYTTYGHEIKEISATTPNWNTNIFQTKAVRLIRHKVSKPAWILKAGGKQIRITEDHSLIVLRNGIKTSVKPYEIQKDDKIIILS